MKKIVSVLLLSVVILSVTACSKTNYTGTWLAFMVEDENGKQYSMPEYFSQFGEEYTVIINIKDDGTYICSSFIGEKLLENERGTYKVTRDRIDFNESKTYSGCMVKEYLAIKYDKVTLYFGKTSDIKPDKGINVRTYAVK